MVIFQLNITGGEPFLNSCAFCKFGWLLRKIFWLLILTALITALPSFCCMFAPVKITAGSVTMRYNSVRLPWSFVLELLSMEMMLIFWCRWAGWTGNGILSYFKSLLLSSFLLSSPAVYFKQVYEEFIKRLKSTQLILVLFHVMLVPREDD